MTRRKREIVGLMNERDFPHIVELALPPGPARGEFGRRRLIWDSQFPPRAAELKLSSLSLERRASRIWRSRRAAAVLAHLQLRRRLRIWDRNHSSRTIVRLTISTDRCGKGLPKLPSELPCFIGTSPSGILGFSVSPCRTLLESRTGATGRRHRTEGPRGRRRAASSSPAYAHSGATARSAAICAIG